MRGPYVLTGEGDEDMTGDAMDERVRTWRRRIAASRAAGLAALPLRTTSVAQANGRLLKESVAWLGRSREHTNYTYDLTPRNHEHLVHWVSLVTRRPVAEVRGYLDEIDHDGNLRDHIRRATLNSPRRGLADREVRFGRRIGWYAITRALKPEHIVGTGTDKGLGSCVFAAALLRNGRGRLTTVDVNADSGYLIAGPYAGVIERRAADSLSVLPGLEAAELFLHDSWHTYDHEAAEYGAECLASQALVLSDNAHATETLVDWAMKSHRSFSYFARNLPTTGMQEPASVSRGCRSPKLSCRDGR